MKIKVLQENLAEGLGTVGRFIPSKTTLPVLGNVMISAQDGKLVLSGSNLELSVRHSVTADVAVKGDITLPARLLADYVALLDHGGTVALELNPKTHKVALVCNRYEANIAGIDADDFPPIPSVSGGAIFSLPAGEFKSAVSQVVFSAASDDTRPVLAGVLMRVEGNTMTLAAADGFRLAVRTIDLPEGTPSFSVIVPAKSFVEIVRLLPSDDAALVNISLAKEGNHVHFAFGETEVTSRLIEGQFPDYTRIIPVDGKTTVTANAPDLLRAVRAAAVFARDNSNIIRFEADPSANGSDTGHVMVRSTSAEMGDNQGLLDAVIEGEQGQIAFNGRYVRDALEALETPQVKIVVSGPSSPGVLRPVGSGATNVLYVIMPMHVAR